MNRDLIISEARAIYAKRYAKDGIPERANCLMWAAAFVEAAEQHGIEAKIHAGSASFAFQPDDGVSATHFSYEYEPAVAVQRFNQGLLPEMHAWAYLPATKELVDLTTKFQAAQAKHMCGFDWHKRFRLPPYLWVRADRIPQPRFIYRPHPIANMMAQAFLEAFYAKEHENSALQGAL